MLREEEGVARTVWVGHSCPTALITGMSRRKKTLFFFAGVFSLLVIFWLIHDIRTKAAQRQVEAQSLEILSNYQRQLHPGDTRAQVEQYLKSQTIAFTWIGGGDFGSGSDAVRIAEEPLDSFFLRWRRCLRGVQVHSFVKTNGRTIRFRCAARHRSWQNIPVHVVVPSDKNVRPTRAYLICTNSLAAAAFAATGAGRCGSRHASKIET